MTGVQTCALPICFPVTIRMQGILAGALKWRQKFAADAQYNDINKHIVDILASKATVKLSMKDREKIVYLYDFFPDVEVMKSLCTLVNRGSHVITKISSYGDAELKTKFNTIFNAGNILSTLIQNDYSDIRSSEIYLHLKLDELTYKKDTPLEIGRAHV